MQPRKNSGGHRRYCFNAYVLKMQEGTAGRIECIQMREGPYPPSIFWPSGLWQVPGLCSVGAWGGPPVKGACLLGGLKAPGASLSPRQGAWGLAGKKWAASPGCWPVQRQLALDDVRGLPEGAGFVSCPCVWGCPALEDPAPTEIPVLHTAWGLRVPPFKRG